MKKQDMIAALSEKTKLGKKQTGVFFANVIDMIMTEISNQKSGGRIRIAGFGTFSVRKRSARKGLNPQTKQPINIPEKNAVVFKPSVNLKEAINKKK